MGERDPNVTDLFHVSHSYIVYLFLLFFIQEKIYDGFILTLSTLPDYHRQLKNTSCDPLELLEHSICDRLIFFSQFSF